MENMTEDSCHGYIIKGGPSGPPAVPVLTSIWNLVTIDNINRLYESVKISNTSEYAPKSPDSSMNTLSVFFN